MDNIAIGQQVLFNRPFKLGEKPRQTIETVTDVKTINGPRGERYRMAKLEPFGFWHTVLAVRRLEEVER